MSDQKILIVDDDSADRFLLRRLLTRAGVSAEFEECLDGELALEYFRATAEDSLPDLVLLDINMPRMNGIEFLQHYAELLKESPQRSVPIIAMLTSVSRSDEEQCLSYDFVVGQATKLHEKTDLLVEQIRQVIGDELK